MSDFKSDIVSGLRHHPKQWPCKYLYDAEGSRLFEAICQTDDYYVTRADLNLHQRHLKAISQRIGPHAHVIELGSGAGVKTQLLLKALESPRAYTPIEISPEALAASVRELQTIFPQLPILPLEADYTQDIPADNLAVNPPAERRVVYFPGSTIGNFGPNEAQAFLQRMGRIAGMGGVVLIGVDLIKPIPLLLAAYDDTEGVTAAFNRNLLHRIQSELGAELDLSAFGHEARYNVELNRVEMHLVALKNTSIQIDDDIFSLSRGETIHTESSYKYSIEGFQALARSAGLNPVTYWKDDEGLFSMHYLEPLTSHTA